MMDPPSRRPARAIAWVVGLASLMTLANAAKPLHMDDAVYHMYAAQLAAHPGDPYGGEVVDYWFPPKAGMDVLAPVFLPYLWSRAIAVHGENVFLAKLWLAPFPLLLVAASWALGRRFARGYEAVLACLVAFSPAILPGQNYMLDVPALALGLAGIALFMTACDRGSWGLAIVSGLLAGAAINTKWTGLLAPATIGLYALAHRRWALGIASILATVGVFAGWEAWIAHEYGRSHFLLHSERKGSPPLMDRINGARALISILGGVAPGVLVTGLVALRRPRWAAVAAGLTVAGIAAIALGLGPQAVFLPLGGLVLLNLGNVAIRLLRRTSDESPEPRCRDDLFLVLWLLLEIAGCFVLSPYSAVRRVLGIVVIASLLVVRLASRTGRIEIGPRPARWASAFGVGLGLFYFAIDYEEAVVDRRAAWDAADRVLGLANRGEGRYFAGRWGFRYHAEQAGLEPVRPGRDTLEVGDWLAVVENKVAEEPRIVIDPADAKEVATLSYDNPRFFPPLRTVPTYYAGKNPLERQVGPRQVVHIYEVNRPFTPLGRIPPWLGPKDRAVGAMMQIGKARR
jgi:hypothetical protein